MDLNYLLYREQIALMRADGTAGPADRAVQLTVARFFGGLASHNFPRRSAVRPVASS